jgi:hypothetical protein
VNFGISGIELLGSGAGRELESAGWLVGYSVNEVYSYCLVLFTVHQFYQQ